jgi:hypothetical protein
LSLCLTMPWRHTGEWMYRSIRHSTLGHNLKFQHRNFGTFSVESLASDSECTLVRAKLSHPQGPPNTFSKRRNQPIQLPLQCSHQCTPQWTHRLTHRAANPKEPASILAPRHACQILATCINSKFLFVSSSL